MNQGSLLAEDADTLRELERRSAACPTHEEMVELNARRLNGDLEAREQMIVLNLPLARWYVMERIGINGFLEDNVQNAAIGLMKAVDRFDPDKSSFSTYAFLWMKQCTIRRHHSDGHTVRVPKNMRYEAQSVLEQAAVLRRTLGRQPTVEEIAEKTGLSKRKIEARLKVPLSTKSMDTELSPESELFNRHDLLEDDFPDPGTMLEAKDAFRQGYKRLLAIHRKIGQYCDKPVRSDWPKFVFKRVGIFGYDSSGMSMEKIGEEHGMCRERIRQIVNGCLAGCVTTKLLPEGIVGLERLADSLRHGMEYAYCLSGSVPYQVRWTLGYCADTHSSKPRRRRTVAKVS